MSFLTGTNVELIYASTAVGIAKNTFTAETALNDEATMGPQARLGSGFWMPDKSSLARGFHISAKGIVSSTATPSYTWTVRLGTTAAATSGPIVLGSAATATASGISNSRWYLEGDVILEAVGTTAGSSTVRGLGTITTDGYTAATTTRILPIFGGAADPGTVATVDLTSTNFVTLNITCTASSSSNTITLQQLLLYGLK